MADSESGSEGAEGAEGVEPPSIVVRRVHPRAVRLHPAFDSCILGELTLDSRWCYSTRRMEGVLCARGWDPEDARQRVARMATVVTEGWPDFLD